MPNWLLKSALHRVISLMPYSQKCNKWFQERVTKSLELGKNEFEARLTDARRFLEYFAEAKGAPVEEFTALELGTGWYPAVPIGLYLCGASEIRSFDIDSLLEGERLKRLLNYFCEADASGTLQRLLPQARRDRMEHLRSVAKDAGAEDPAATLAKLHIRAEVRDARNTGLKAGTIDLFFSNVVLEYVPAEVQAGVFAEFHRIGKPGAVILQHVNLKDQYSNFDAAITPFNFLKYSSARWRWLDSPLIPQTRLRISDYRALLVKGGFEIIKEVSASGSSADLEEIRLAPEFQKYTKEDLLVIDTWQVARRV